MSAPTVPAFLHAFPGAVLRISATGRVLASNGVLERETGARLEGASFAELLDAESSREKWERFLGAGVWAAGDGGSSVASAVELILRGTDSLPEPRSFLVLPEPASEELWVLELQPDLRMAGLREQVEEVNSELANTQRDLLKERGRLARALSELEEQYAATERLARRVQEQNRKLAEQNQKLQALTEELRVQSAELARSNHDLDQFAHVVSHDLKAPLRSIASYAAWLEEDLGPAITGESREHLQRLRDRAGAMRAMIDGVLQYARAGRENAPVEPVAVNALLDAVIALLDPPDTAVIEVEQGMPTLLARRAPLQQVFLNLLSNALQHAAEAPRIRVGWEDAGERVVFTVADNGRGIPAAEQARIWDLFGTGSGEGGTGGSGIGLAVVRRLVEGVGGSVEVDSGVGEGARFRFSWPRRLPPAPPGGQ